MRWRNRGPKRWRSGKSTIKWSRKRRRMGV